MKGGKNEWKREMEKEILKREEKFENLADGELVAKVMHDLFHVPWLAHVAVPTQTAAYGRSGSPTAPLFLALCTPHRQDK